MKRRQFLAGSGALAGSVILGSCGNEGSLQAQEQAGAGDAARTAMPDAAGVPDAVSAGDAELVSDFLAESFAEPDARAGLPADTVTSLADLEQNPDLFAQAGDVIGEVVKGNIKAADLADEQSADYAHFLAEPELQETGRLDATAFQLTSDVMRSICAANHYDIDAIAGDTVLIGLRGCVLASGTSASGERVTVMEAAIDHLKRRCLVGVWNKATGQIEVFEGSTVPNLVNMQLHLFWKYAQDPATGAAWPHRASALTNQLPQGLHAYRVGTHLRWSSPARRHPGALIQAAASPVLRAQSDLAYSVFESWDPLDWRPDASASDRNVRITGNNIHAAVNRNFPGYASQGCQTVQGYYNPKGQTPAGAWADFQTSLGIEVVENEGQFVSNFDDQDIVYRYLLTTGREARLHAGLAPGESVPSDLKRLRIGSSGLTAANLRSMLGLTGASAVMDAEAMNEFLRWQSSRMPKDGAVTARLDRDHVLGLSL